MKPTITLLSLTGLFLLSACDTLRFAPSQAQKQNAWLHHRTASTIAQQTKVEQSSPQLQTLADRSAEQSEAMTAYFGPPHELPPAGSVDQLLNDDNRAITQQAHDDAIQRPDPFDAADYVIEIALSFAGLIGGVYSTRIVAFLQRARTQSHALSEIVRANEQYKQRHPDQRDAFKQSHNAQSPQTRQLVAQLKT